MRVLVVGLNYDPEPTGIAPYTSALCRGLQRRGHRVRVLTTMPHYPQWRIREGYEAWARHDVVDGVPVTRLRHYVPAKPTSIRRLLSECSFGLRVAMTRWGAPDVVVFVSPALFASGVAILGRVPVQPYVVWVQDVYSLGFAETRQGAGSTVGEVIRRLEGMLFRRATGVAVIHERFGRVVEALGVRSEQVRVIRNWSHLPRRSQADRVALRRELGWPEDRIQVVHSGAMGLKQDLMNVIEAARFAEDRGVPVRFVLMGAGSERERLQAAAEGLSTVQFLDPLPTHRFQDVLQAADVLLVNEHAGLREMAVPSKLTSYFSSGRPVVAATSDDSITAEEIASSGGGVRVDPGDPAMLLDTVLELAQDEQEARRLGASGREYELAVLSEDAALGRYVSWLEDLAAQHRRRPVLGRVRAALTRRLWSPPAGMARPPRSAS